MNLRVAQEIVGTLIPGGAPGDCHARLSRIPPGQWEAASSWLRRSGLALYWWSRIKSNNAEHAVPAETRAGLDADLQENGARLCAMAEEFQTLLKLIEGAEIPYVVLKGFALTPEYCPDPALRNQYDFDFLVDADSLQGIDEALGHAGYVKKLQRPTSSTLEYFHALRRPVVPKNLDKVFAPGLHRTVEIHACLWDPMIERIWFDLPGNQVTRAVLKTWRGIAFKSLAPQDELLLQVLHIFRHILNNQCRLSHLFEVATFLSQHSAEDSIWPGFQNVIQNDARLREACGIVFSLASQLFQVELPGEVRAFTVDRLSVPSTFWVHRHGLQSALSNFTASKSSLYLHSLFVDSKSDWVEVRRRRLFPFQKPATVARASRRDMASHARAKSTQFAHVVRRTWFHGVAAVKYAWGLPEWARVRKSTMREANSKRANGIDLAPGPMRGK